jgi:cyclic pyranopterin phosphate synthase
VNADVPNIEAILVEERDVHVNALGIKGVGEIGIIAPVTQAFCGACSRVRLTSDGKIRTCLFSQSDHDLYGVARRGAKDGDLAVYIVSTIEKKEARHHIGEPGFLKPSRSMVHIGG